MDLQNDQIQMGLLLSIPFKAGHPTSTLFSHGSLNGLGPCLLDEFQQMISHTPEPSWAVDCRLHGLCMGCAHCLSASWMLRRVQPGAHAFRLPIFDSPGPCPRCHWLTALRIMQLLLVARFPSIPAFLHVNQCLQVMWR